MLTFIDKHVLVENPKLQSFIKAEWDTVRVNQLLLSNWRKRLKLKRFEPNFCGLLFFNNYAYASNGHWLMRIQTDGPPMIRETQFFFFSYVIDDIVENYNPFQEQLGISLLEMDDVLEGGNAWDIELSFYAEDLIAALEMIEMVRDRRYYQALFEPQNADECSIALIRGADLIENVFDTYYTGNGIPFVPYSFMINAGYLYKIVDFLRGEDCMHIHMRFLNLEGAPIFIYGERANKEIPSIIVAMAQMTT